jgi:hypothetical protein
LWAIPVATSVIATWAFGTVAPVASVTVPLSIAPATCAYVRPVPKRPIAKKVKIDKVVLHVFANVEVRIEISSDGHLTAHPKNEADQQQR